MILAAKCAPQKEKLSDICKAGIAAVELYLSGKLLRDVPGVVSLCKDFPLRYALHAPCDDYPVEKLAELAGDIAAEVVVFHNAYWEDEWEDIIRQFKGIPSKLCIENTHSVNESNKFMRRYGMGRCLDIEHMQMEALGVFEEAFVAVMREASHIHLTGYRFGSALWHTHLHHSPKHNRYMLGLLRGTGYRGFVVSEAKVSLQTYEEFKKLREFYDRCWDTTGPGIIKQQ